MDSQGRHPYLPKGFELSSDPLSPSHVMQGALPDMLRSFGHSRHRSHDVHPMLSNGNNNDRFGVMQPFSMRHGQSFFGHDDPFASMHQQIMSMQQGLMSNGTQSFMESRQSGFGGSGVYQSSVQVMSSFVDKDGKRKVERYKKAAFGDHERDIHEVKEAFSDDRTNRDIMAMERRQGQRGIQMIRNHDRNTQVIDELTNPVNIEEDEIDTFNQQWAEQVHDLRHRHPSLRQEYQRQQHQPQIESRHARRQLH